jgi:hypothetical protein
MNSKLSTIMMVVFAAGFGGLGGWVLGKPAPPVTSATMQHDAPNLAIQAEKPCRSGAFMDADKILGAVLEANTLLPAKASEGAKKQLDFILFVTLKQAKEEAHCIAGIVPSGYEQTFIETLQKSIALARARQLSPDLIKIAQDAISVLKAGKPSLSEKR